MTDRLELAQMVLREILKHPDFIPPKPLPHNPMVGETCPQCGQNDSHMSHCLIGAALTVINDGERTELPERLGPVRYWSPGFGLGIYPTHPALANA